MEELCELFPAFQAEMSSASLVVPLPVLMKDEKKYAEVVGVLDQLEVWVKEIYSKAGRCARPEAAHVLPGPPIGSPLKT